MAGLSQIEGTILTEGAGSAKGTRFRVEGPNQRLQVGGQEQGVTGGRGGVGAVARDIEAGNPIRPQMREPLKQTMYATTGSGVSSEATDNVGALLVRSANKYADDMTTNEALEKRIEFSDYARKAFHGDEEAGKEGFKTLKGKAAIDARSTYFKDIDTKYSEVLSTMSPAARTKAMAALQSDRETALNRGASHIDQAKTEYENELRYKNAQDAIEEMVIDHSSPEKVASVKSQYAQSFGLDEKEMQKQWDQSALIASNKVYLDADKATGSGVAALKAYQKSINSTLTIDGQNRLDEYIIAQEKQEKAEQKALEGAHEKRSKAMRDNIAISAWLKAEKDPERNLKISNIIADNPGIDPVDVKSTHELALKNVEDKYTKTPDETKFTTEVLFPMQEKGELFESRMEFAKTAQRYGIGVKRAQELYDAENKILEGDEKTLFDIKKNYTDRIDKAFGTVSEEAALGLGIQPKEDPEANKLKSSLLAISKRIDMTPLQKNEEMNKYLQDKLKDEGTQKEVAEKLNTVELINELGEKYRVKARIKAFEPPTSKPSQAPVTKVESVDISGSDPEYAEYLDSKPDVEPAAAAQLRKHKIISEGADQRAIKSGEETLMMQQEGKHKGMQVDLFFDKKIGRYVKTVTNPKTGEAKTTVLVP